MKTHVKKRLRLNWALRATRASNARQLIRVKRPLFCMTMLALVVGTIAWPMVALAGTTEQYGGSYANWPTTWTPISSLNDPDDGVAAQLDFVGDNSNPGAYYAGDDNYVYFRVRVDVGTVTTGTFGDTVMILIDKEGEGTAGEPDYAFAWDSKEAQQQHHGLELMLPYVVGNSWGATRMNDKDGDKAKKTAPPDFRLTGGDGYIRTIDEQSTTSFGTTTFIDFAISWSYLSSDFGGSPITTLGKNQTWKIQFGSIASANDHNWINTDVAGNHNPSESGLSWSDQIGFGPNTVTLTRLKATSAPPRFPVGTAAAALALMVSSVVVSGVLVLRRRNRLS